MSFQAIRCWILSIGKTLVNYPVLHCLHVFCFQIEKFCAKEPQFFFILIDTPPGTSDEHLTAIKVLKNVKPDGAIIVTTPQGVSIATVRREISFCRKMGLKILGLVVNMSSYVCPCCDVRGLCTSSSWLCFNNLVTDMK